MLRAAARRSNICLTVLPVLLFKKPVREEYLQPRMDKPLFLAATCPLFSDVYHGQIQHFQCSLVRREYRFGLGNFAQLTIEILNGVCGVNKSARLLRILEIR